MFTDHNDYDEFVRHNSSPPPRRDERPEPPYRNPLGRALWVCCFRLRRSIRCVHIPAAWVLLIILGVLCALFG